MYACLHQPAAPNALTELAGEFSPAVEVTAPGTVVFSIAGLTRLFGAPQQIASEIARRGAQRGIMANLAIAANPDAAVLAAMHLPGVTLIPPGEEAQRLGEIPLARLSLPAELYDTLTRWGLRNLEDIAALPPLGLAERLGEEGLRLYNLAHGRRNRPLKLAPPPTSYEERLEVEHPVSELEPLMFLLGRLLQEICRRLEAQSMAANRITATLRLAGGNTYTRILELPVPQAESRTLLKLMQLDLEAHPPPAPVEGVTLALSPAPPRRAQGGLFLPQAPEPEKLQVTLARLEHLAGQGNAGSPALLDTHRPDAFVMRPFAPAALAPERAQAPAGALRLAIRRYRPPLAARVRLRQSVPFYVAARGIGGEVMEAAGPWRASGDWWTEKAWGRDEWDVALTDGGLYRLFCTLPLRQWFVEGVYD